MTLSITPLYAALLALVFLVLSFRVIFVRRGERISLGDGENPALRARVRVHANFAEYTPLALLLMLMAELLGDDPPSGRDGIDLSRPAYWRPCQSLVRSVLIQCERPAKSA